MDSVHDFNDVKERFQVSLRHIDELVQELRGYENIHLKNDITIMSYDMLVSAISNMTLDNRQRFSVGQIKELEQMRKNKIKEVFEKGDK